MSAWNLVFLDASTFDREDVSFKRFTDRYACTFHRVTAPAQTAERLRGRQAVVTNKVQIDAAAMDANRESLKLIAVAATGTNNVDLAAARARGIPVCNVAGYSGPSVAQHTFALLLELCNHAGRYAEDNRREAAWSKSPFFCLLTYPCVELRGKTLGLLGYGDIGRHVEAMARGFGMEVLVAARRGAKEVLAGRVAFDEVLQRADVVSVHCPLTPETRDLLGARELALLKPSAFVLNASRGGIVNEDALLEALKAKRIAGAGLDVLSAEPPPTDHPLCAAARELDNLILTPHSAWSTLESRQRLLDEVFENVRAFEEGRERNRVG
ncbi:MAG: D-2-hydroxyacid dehydrogenase [Planctomycetota bacterium]|nr:D-2-hydroxyacid dehydrogenase [Planctomycetota bacterium]